MVEVLGEAEGRICIEDVLPLFPDFVTIDAFKAAICSSLEDYNAQIEGLKTEMADSTRIADALRYILEGRLQSPYCMHHHVRGSVQVGPMSDGAHTIITIHSFAKTAVLWQPWGGGNAIHCTGLTKAPVVLQERHQCAGEPSCHP